MNENVAPKNISTGKENKSVSWKGGIKRKKLQIYYYRAAGFLHNKSFVDIQRYEMHIMWWRKDTQTVLSPLLWNYFQTQCWIDQNWDQQYSYGTNLVEQIAFTRIYTHNENSLLVIEVKNWTAVLNFESSSKSCAIS